MYQYYTVMIAITAFGMIAMQFCINKSTSLTNKRKHLFCLLYGIIALAALCEWGGVSLEGGPPQSRILHIAVKMLELSIAPSIGFIFSWILEKKWVRWILLFLGIHVILEVLSGFFGFIYRVDENNCYHHGSFYWIYVLSYMVSLVYAIHVVVGNIRKFQYSGYYFFTAIVILMMSGIVVQLINSDLKVDYLSISMASALLYVFTLEMIQQTDELTELLNRRGYENYIANIDKNCMVVFFDVDRFKMVNDTYGHAFGDEALKTIGRTIKKHYASSGKCFRYGGDEFCAILDRNMMKIELLNHDFFTTLSDLRKKEGRLPTVSIGYAYYDPEKQSIQDMVEEADHMMYEYKESHREEKIQEVKSPHVLTINQVFQTLGDDYIDVYSVKIQTEEMHIYRMRSQNVGITDVICEGQKYSTVRDAYVENNVFEDDKHKLRSVMDIRNICNHLKQASQFIVHYRIKRNGELTFHYVKCVRIGDAKTFDSFLLAFASEDDDVRRADLANAIEDDISYSKRKILIVEDNELNRELLSGVLEDEYEILTAENGEVGLKVLEENYQDLSVVLLDVQMPVLNGFQFLERMQADPLISSVPVIVTTAANSQDTELQCLNLGATDFVTKPYNAMIVKSRIRSVIKLRESTKTLSQMERDDLTGLYTKQAFFHHLKILNQNKSDGKIHIFVAEIMNFKQINQTYGMKRGNELLKYLGVALQKSLKLAFISGLVARYSGASFAGAILIQDELSHEAVLRAFSTVEKDMPVPGVQIKCGIYESADRTIPVDQMCDRAFLAAESIQRDYERSIAYYTLEMDEKLSKEREVENRFEDAISKEEFVVYYQPKVDTETEKATGAECLVRWKPEDGSVISPGAFIPVYERDGLIVKLDEYVFRKVISFQKKRMKEGVPLMPLSVNLSRASIHFDGLVEHYTKLVQEAGIPFDCVPIELTESAAIYSSEIKKIVERLVEAGFSLHMDDFGSGFSSLTSLNQLPFSVLKIDKSLIDCIEEERGRIVVEQSVMLAKTLHMEIVAEGVETKEQADLLRLMKVDQIQGFYYAKPMPEEDFKAYMKENT